jgi:nucleoside diphosphate kinase
MSRTPEILEGVPHDLPAAEVLDLLPSQINDNPNLAIYMCKPGFWEAPDNTVCRDEALDTITQAGLNVLCTSEAVMTHADVCQLYGKVLPPNPEDDAKWGASWKQQLVTYLASNAVLTVLVEGDGAQDIARDVKNKLRARYTEGGTVVRNVAHAPDSDDMAESIGVLFLGGLQIRDEADAEREIVSLDDLRAHVARSESKE